MFPLLASAQLDTLLGQSAVPIPSEASLPLRYELRTVKDLDDYRPSNRSSPPNHSAPEMKGRVPAAVPVLRFADD